LYVRPRAARGFGNDDRFQTRKDRRKSKPFRDLLDRFEQENPGITVKDETLPASTDEQHQFYAINLDSQSTDFDVLSLTSSGFRVCAGRLAPGSDARLGGG
jgi:hypothetical protein